MRFIIIGILIFLISKVFFAEFQSTFLADFDWILHLIKPDNFIEYQLHAMQSIDKKIDNL